MTEEEYMRVVVAPYWCRGDPLLWETRTVFGQKVGIADLARDAKVGKFNLCWWLLDLPYPPQLPETYRLAPLQWALRTAPTLRLNGKTFEEMAAIMSLPTFNNRISRMLDRLQPENLLLLSAYGVTPQTLRHLASRGNQAA